MSEDALKNLTAFESLQSLLNRLKTAADSAEDSWTEADFVLLRASVVSMLPTASADDLGHLETMLLAAYSIGSRSKESAFAAEVQKALKAKTANATSASKKKSEKVRDIVRRLHYAEGVPAKMIPEELRKLAPPIKRSLSTIYEYLELKDGSHL